MKTIFYAITAGLIGIITIAAIPNEGETVKVTVVKHSGNETTVYDTSFSSNSGYTVEQYLIDNGLDVDKTEIIDTDAFDGKYSWKRDDSFLFLNGKENSKNSSTAGEEIVIEEVVEEITDEFSGESHKEIIVIKKEGKDGESVVTKTVIHDGEETVTEEVIGEDGFVFVLPEDEEIENMETIFEEMDIDVEGLEKNLEGLGEDFEGLEEELKDLMKRLKIEQVIGVDGAQKELKLLIETMDDIDSDVLIDTAFASPRKVRVISNFTSHENHDNPNVFFREMTGKDYAVAIVTRSGKVENETQGFISDEVKLPIEGPFYYPNPTAGQFRLEFFLPERGQTQIQVFDMQGKMVYQDDLGDFQGAYNNEVNLNNLKHGSYVLNITQNSLRLAEKIIVN